MEKNHMTIIKKSLQNHLSKKITKHSNKKKNKKTKGDTITSTKNKGK